MKKKLPKKKILNNGKTNSYEQELEKTKDFFLEKSIDISQAPTPYLVEDEFVKAKKNRNYLNLFILLISCTFLITFAFFIVSFYQERQEKITLRIEEFSDINIEEVLVQANSFKNELLQRREVLLQLEEKKESELQQVNFLYDSKIRNLLANNSISDEIRQSRSKVFLSEKQQQERAIGEKYDNDINDLNNEISELVQKVSELDQQAIEQAIKTDDFIGYQEKLLDTRIQGIENSYKKNINKIISDYEESINNLIIGYEETINNLVDDYEERIAIINNTYNPTQVSTEVERILELEKYQTRLNNQTELNELNLAENSLTKNSTFYENFLEFREQEKEVNFLLKEINAISFYNKSQQMTQTLNLIYSDYFVNLNNLFLSLNEEEKKKNVFLDFINFYLEKMGYVGVVVEIKNRKGIIIINELFQNSNFTRGFFFNEDTKKKIIDFKIINNQDGKIAQNLYPFEIQQNNQQIKTLTPIVFYNN